MKFFLFSIVLVMVLFISVAVWLILEPGRASECDNSLAYHLGYVALGLNPVHRPVRIKTKFGTLSGSYHKSPVLKHLFLSNGVYEPVIVKSLEKDITEGNAFVDVGAKEGYFSLVASQLVGIRGHVFIFETDHDYLQTLKDHHSITYPKNVSILEFAPMAFRNEEPKYQLQRPYDNIFIIRPENASLHQSSVLEGCPIVERYRSMWPQWLDLRKLKSSKTVRDLKRKAKEMKKSAVGQLRGPQKREANWQPNTQVKVHTTELDRAILIENESLGLNKLRLDKARMVVHINFENDIHMHSAVSNLIRLQSECKEMIFYIRMVPNQNPITIQLLKELKYVCKMIDVYSEIIEPQVTEMQKPTQTNAAKNAQQWLPLDEQSKIMKYTRWERL